MERSKSTGKSTIMILSPKQKWRFRKRQPKVTKETERNYLGCLRRYLRRFSQSSDGRRWMPRHDKEYSRIPRQKMERIFLSNHIYSHLETCWNKTKTEMGKGLNPHITGCVDTCSYSIQGNLEWQSKHSKVTWNKKMIPWEGWEKKPSMRNL